MLIAQNTKMIHFAGFLNFYLHHFRLFSAESMNITILKSN